MNNTNGDSKYYYDEEIEAGIKGREERPSSTASALFHPTFQDVLQYRSLRVAICFLNSSPVIHHHDWDQQLRDTFRSQIRIADVENEKTPLFSLTRIIEI